MCPPLREKRNLKRISVMTAAVTVAVIAAVLMLIAARPAALELYDADSGELYGVWEAYDGLAFSVEFIHSVNKSPVIDFFEIRGDKVAAAATTYYAFGAGVQTELEGDQVLTYNEDGSMTITGFDLEHDKLGYIVGTVSDHILEIDGRQISLRDLCGRNAAVVFEVREGFARHFGNGKLS